MLIFERRDALDCRCEIPFLLIILALHSDIIIHYTELRVSQADFDFSFLSFI